MRIAIVNDSFMALESLRRVISQSPHEVVWVAHDGAEAVWRCKQDRPDLILMDLIMPVMDGVEATRRIMGDSPCAILVVTATVEGNASKVFQAMGHGALDAVNTPVLGANGDAAGKDELLRKISTVEKLLRQSTRSSSPSSSVPMARRFSGSGGLLAIGASSGGPQALARVLSALPVDFPHPVVIVQHVDAQFSAELAAWLNQQCALEVRLARSGDILKQGRVLVAGANDHLVLMRDHRLEYTPDPVEQAYRPSVDVFFESLAAHWDRDLVAVLLTGMGRDGAQGMLQLRNKGVHTIAQDEGTCAVYGMPKAAAKLNAAVEILPLDVIGTKVLEYFDKNTNKIGRQGL